MITFKDITRKRLIRSPLICHICGDTARGKNFNVITCMACKAFFRRNALLPLNTLQCKHKSNCKITMETRAHCPACRLKKCFEFGMKCELIRSFTQDELDSDRMQQFKNIKQQQQIQLPWPRSLDLLENDRSTLTIEQWNLLSNIIHVYDNQNSINRARILLAETSTLPIKLRSKICALNFVNHYATSTQRMLEQSSIFSIQSINIRRVLIENNMFCTSVLNGALIAREIDIFGTFDYGTCIDRFVGPNYFIKYDLFLKRLDSSNTLWKLMIFIIVLSSNSSIIMQNHLSNISNKSYSINLINIQNIFVDLLWKYLIYKYGFMEAVLRYSSLIKVVLDLLHIFEEILDMEVYYQIYNLILSKTEHLLITDN